MFINVLFFLFELILNLTLNNRETSIRPKRTRRLAAVSRRSRGESLALESEQPGGARKSNIHFNFLSYFSPLCGSA